ncbi:hypothetical protein [Arthrobacter sp. StoSoilB13]|uniref:hypothetical protein n=1 Tax=Arthrobacter sp. StoSoilB13 TaxID=2830993 RepID=UPI001CC4DF7B|nr:hypothetical protein [Arthrobacter sp. StoSoilB13]
MPVNDYFARLMKSENLVPSLDPPSDAINGAKLERHLNYSDGMVAVLTDRGSKISPYIDFEISLAIRGRRPLLVFVEDTLPTGIVPHRVLQQRFSHRSFLRQAREHRQALRTLRAYLGEQPGPRYQSSESKRSCLVLGDHNSPQRDAFVQFLDSNLGYEPLVLNPTEGPPVLESDWWDAISHADVAVALEAGDPSASDAYALGAVRGALRPLIVLTTDKSAAVASPIPVEYRPRQVESFEFEALQPALIEEFSLLEQDFLDLDDQGEVARYSQQLIELDGHYGPSTRERVTEVVVGDKYEVSGQAAAVGPNAHVHHVSFNQLWLQKKDELDLGTLASELELVRVKARATATSPEEDDATAEAGKAQRAAEAGDGPTAMSHLARAGNWVLSIAEDVGAAVVSAAIKASIGM